MSSYVVGLTGGIACGKSTLAKALMDAGAQVIDADDISRALTAPGGEALPAVRQVFGDAVFDGEVLNRARLGQLVFQDEEKRLQLNVIIHPLVIAKMQAQMDALPGIVVIVVPLLYESGMEMMCNEVWCAYIPQDEQIRRLRARDHLTHKQALARVRSQMPAMTKARLADRVIRTDGSIKNSATIVLSYWTELLQKENLK